MASDKLQRDMPYRLANSLTLAECKRCGVDPKRPQEKLSIMAVWTGERRSPKAGEWYLSGAPVEAWKAPHDFLDSMVYDIARLVKVERREVITFMPIDEEGPDKP